MTLCVCIPYVYVSKGGREARRTESIYWCVLYLIKTEFNTAILRGNFGRNQLLDVRYRPIPNLTIDCMSEPLRASNQFKLAYYVIGDHVPSLTFPPFCDGTGFESCTVQ